MAWASSNDKTISASQSSTSVVVFMDSQTISDGKAVAQMRDVLKEKFKHAKSVEIYGDEQAKSPEFLEFTERIKTDPANEKYIKVINIGELTKYGQSTNSDYVILITISPFNPNYVLRSFDMKGNITVVDVSTQKYLDYVNFYKEGILYREGAAKRFSGGAKDIVNQIAFSFSWNPGIEESNNDNRVNQVRENKPSVIVFLPDVILERSDLVEKVKKTISDKFQVSDVPIYSDDRKKSPEFLDLISTVEADRAKYQAFIMRKENLVRYGKMINANPLVVIVISNTGVDAFKYRLKADVFVIDTESNKYLSNVIFDTIDNKKRAEGIEFLMNKFKNEFELPK
jgi:hypothetical protein